MKKDIRSMSLPELRAEVAVFGLPLYRAGQIYRWLHAAGVTSFDAMSDLPLETRRLLDDNFVIFLCSIEKKMVSEYDGTVKYLFKLHDGAYIETVWMQYKYGCTVCVSTQVGCKMGCRFCASAQNGFVRNLQPSEMLAQVYAAMRDNGVRVSHVVLMGMGEPLDNYDNVLRFIRLLTAPEGLHLGMRCISLSTCGIVPMIYRLMEENLQLTLSVSLHAPNDEIRSEMMPVNSRWSTEELLNACRAYAKSTSRRISFEYAMVRGVNDTDACAKELAARLRGMLCHVNLIPVNAVEQTRCVGSAPERVKRFASLLEKSGLTVTVRRTLGADIDAACGQLRRRQMKGE